MPSTLGYWDTRGLAQPLRYLLTYVGEDFEDVQYSVGEGPEFNKDDWLNVKHTLDLSFPNLPYYMDDEVKITNTNAIFKYLGRKHKLNGENDQEKANCDMGLELVMDFRNAFIKLCYLTPAEKFKEDSESYVKNAKAKLSTFNDFLGDKPFFVGPKVKVCDFHLYEMLDQHRIFEPTILDGFPKLQEYCKRFESLSGIKEYVESGKAKALPINNKMATFIR